MENTATKIYQVSELGNQIKHLLETDFGQVWVEGEVSGLSQPPSGHIYFDLKDAQAVINVAFFRGSQRNSQVELKNGKQVKVFGDLTAFPRSSRYQIICRKVEEAGLGKLHEAFERLKAKLKSEGLFDSERKKPLPVLPLRIGIVTSPTGAALQDMLNILERRYSNLHIRIAPSRVQGTGAAVEIAAGIERLNRLGDIDVIIIGRGGGSMEDLWAFNEECVARAIAASRLPIISAVGHETDFCISDFVADLRAPTPSAAAELVIGRKSDFEEALSNLENRLRRQLMESVQTQSQRLDHAGLRLRRGLSLPAERAGAVLKQAPLKLQSVMRKILHQRSTKIQSLQSRLEDRSPQTRLNQARERLRLLDKRLHPLLPSELSGNKQMLSDAERQLNQHIQKSVQQKLNQLDRAVNRLEAMNPLAVLGRGYSLTETEGGGVLTDVAQVSEGETVITTLASGTLSSTIKKLNPKEK